MELTPIKSSMMNGYHYNEDSRALTVEFSSGAVYCYDNVNKELVDNMVTHESPGSYFSKSIKNFHPNTRLK